MSAVVMSENKANHSKSTIINNDSVKDDMPTIPVRTQRKRIDPKTDEYKMALPQEGEVRVITTYKDSPAEGEGRKIGGKHKAMNVSRSNLETMLVNEDISTVENDHLVYSTSTGTINGELNVDLSVMIGNYYPSSFDSLAVEEYHEKEIFGKDIKVAVFDTGLNIKSTELNIVGGATFVDGSDSFADDNGHGTSMAGIIGAAMDNEGITGIAPDAELYSVKVLDSNGIGYTSGVIEGIYWAVENDIDIICFGFAADEYSSALAEAVAYAKNNGILMIAPSGNDGENAVKYPAGYNEVVSVGSVNNVGTISNFSNFGSTVDFFAPGESIDSIVYANNKPTPFSGTSASAAHAAGFAALLLEENKKNAEFDAFEYFLGTVVETEFGFVENTESEVAMTPSEVLSHNNQLNTFDVQKSAEKLSTYSCENTSVLSVERLINPPRPIATDILNKDSLVRKGDIDYYSVALPAVSQSVFFHLNDGNCRIFYEDEYSGLNLEVTNEVINLQQGTHYFYVCFNNLYSFNDSEAYEFELVTDKSNIAEKSYYAGHGVDTATGNFNYAFDDLKTIVAGQEFKIQRFYNSRDVEETNTSCIDSGWMLNYGVKADYYTTLYFRLNEENMYEEVYEENKNFIIIITPEGEALNFIKRADGVWNPNNSRAKIDTNLDLTNDIVITMPDQTSYYYYPLNESSKKDYPDADSLGCLYKVVDRYGNTTNITVNDGLVEEITDAVGNVYSFTYGAYDNLTSISDSNGRIVTYTYSGATLVASTDAQGITYYYTYSSGNLYQIKNSKNEAIVTLTYEKDDDEDYIRYKVKTMIDQYGTKYEYDYDEINNCTTIEEKSESSDAICKVTSTTYDAEKDLIYLVDELGRQATVEYFYQQTGNSDEVDNQGEKCYVVDDSYHRWKNGEILKYVDYTGTITEYEFDHFGNGLAESKTVKNSSGDILEYEEYEYNPNGDVILLESWTYRPETASERTRKATRFVYEGTKLVKKAEYLPTLIGSASVPELNDTNLSKYAVTSYEYDTDNAIKGLVSKVVYPAQYTGATTDKGWVYEYGEKGNQISLTNPESTETNEIKDTYEYNDLGLVSKHTSGEGVVTEYEYNNNLQETKKTVTTENGTEVTFTEYNNLGLPVQIVSPNEYNAAYEKDDGTYSKGTVGVRYTYNDNGTVASEIDNEGNCTEYEYDKYGNVQTKIMKDGCMYLYEYDLLSNINKICFKKNTNSEKTFLEENTYKYENENTVLTQTKYNKKDRTSCFKYVYGYKDRLHEVWLVDLVDNEEEKIRELRYDLVGNLVCEFNKKADNEWVATYYTYDNYDETNCRIFDEKITSIEALFEIPVENSIPTDLTYKYERTDYDKNGNVVRTLVSTVAEASTPTLADANVITEVSEYYADNLLKSKTDIYGVKTEYEYDKDRNLSKVTVTEPGKAPQIIAYTNSHNGKPETIKTYVDDANVTDSDNLLTDSLGTYTLTTNTYDKNGNLTKQVSSTGLTTEYTYNDNNLQTSVSSCETGDASSAQSESVVYDFRGNVTQQTDKNGNVTQFVYNELGHLIYTIHPNERITLTVRDNYGKILTEINAVDYKGVATKDAANMDTYSNDLANLSSMNRTEYTYDAFDRVTKETRCYKDIVTQSYTTVDVSTNTYDLIGNLIATTDARGNTFGYEYDVFGNCTKYIEPSKYGTEDYTTFYEYDMLGRKIKEGKSNDDYYEYTYNKKGNILNSAIAEDGESQIMSSYTYDNGGRLLKQTDGNGNTTTLEYDHNNRLEKQHAPKDEDDETETKTDYYSYDVLGNLTEHTTRNGDTIEYEYDVFNRLVKTTSDDGVVTYTYDKNGNILTMTDSTGTTTYTYDSMGRILTKMHSETGTISYTYDIYEDIPYGYVAELTTEPEGQIVERWYDSEDKLIKVIDEDQVTEYTYYGDGKLKKTTTPDGRVSFNTYDDEGNLITLVTYDSAGDVFDSFTYVYDDNSIGYKNQISKTETISGVSRGTTTYEYDIQGRLTKVTNPDGSTNEYTYDNAGNRLSKTATSSETVVTTTYTYDDENRLTQSETGNAITYYGYDNNGNQISEWTRITGSPVISHGVKLSESNEDTDDLMTLYEYDVFDRLIKIEQGEDVIENVYTADGKKFSRTTNGVLTYYVYDGNVVLNEQCSNNAIIARNVYGRNLISRDTFHGDGNYSYNGHGDVIRWNNKSLNMFIEYDYDEFGNIVSEETYDYSINTFAPSGVIIPDYADDRYNDIEFNVVVTPYRYAGYEYIEEIGIYDLNARYYNPEIARFLSQDPYYNLGNRVIGLYEINVPTAASIMQANNIYVYCGNSPIIIKDGAGYYWETFLDVASLFWSIGTLIGDPSWENAGNLVWDAGSLLLPIPGSYAGKAVGKIDDVIDLGKAANKVDNVVDAKKTANKIDNAIDVGKTTSKVSNVPEWIGRLDNNIDDLPEGWSKVTNNGHTHIRDENGKIRVRIDPPDKSTPYTHKHFLDENGQSLDRYGNVVNYKSPEAHIPLD